MAATSPGGAVRYASSSLPAASAAFCLLLSLTLCLGALCGITRHSQMANTTPRDTVAAVSQRGRPMRRCRHETQSDHFLEKRERKNSKWEIGKMITGARDFSSFIKLSAFDDTKSLNS